MPLLQRLCHLIACDGPECRRTGRPQQHEQEAVTQAQEEEWERDGPHWYCRRCQLIRQYGDPVRMN